MCVWLGWSKWCDQKYLSELAWSKGVVVIGVVEGCACYWRGRRVCLLLAWSKGVVGVVERV